MTIAKAKPKSPRGQMVVTAVALTPALLGALRLESEETKKPISKIMREALIARYLSAGEVEAVQP